MVPECDADHISRLELISCIRDNDSIHDLMTFGTTLSVVDWNPLLETPLSSLRSFVI